MFFGKMSFLGALILNLLMFFFVIFWRSQSYLLKYLEYKVFGINLVYKKNKRAKKTEFLMVFIERKKKNMFILKRTPF